MYITVPQDRLEVAERTVAALIRTRLQVVPLSDEQLDDLARDIVWGVFWDAAPDLIRDEEQDDADNDHGQWVPDPQEIELTLDDLEG